MRILVLSDKECPALWDYYRPGCLDGIDLILSCGDLKASYLSFLVTMGRAPLLYVHGNHDGRYSLQPPEGCECIEDRLVIINGIRILGLGGSAFYGGNEHQYTELQMKRRLSRLRGKIRRAGGVDILLTHAPAKGCGDGEDYAHRGFECFLDFMAEHKPKYHIHGHIHMNYGSNIPRVDQHGDTTIVNAFERYIIEL